MSFWSMNYLKNGISELNVFQMNIIPFRIVILESKISVIPLLTIFWESSLVHLGTNKKTGLNISSHIFFFDSK